MLDGPPSPWLKTTPFGAPSAKKATVWLPPPSMPITRSDNLRDMWESLVVGFRVPASRILGSVFKRLVRRTPVGGFAGQKQDPLLRTAQLRVTLPQQGHSGLVPRQRGLQADLAVLQVAHHGLELFERILERER